MGIFDGINRFFTRKAPMELPRQVRAQVQLGNEGKTSHVEMGLVANGREIIRSSDSYLRKVGEIYLRARERYSAEYANASWLKKAALTWKMRREVREEIEKLAPSHALYLTKDRQS